MLRVLITARSFAVNPESVALLRAHDCTLVHAWQCSQGNGLIRPR